MALNAVHLRMTASVAEAETEASALPTFSIASPGLSGEPAPDQSEPAGPIAESARKEQEIARPHCLAEKRPGSGHRRQWNAVHKAPLRFSV